MRLLVVEDEPKLARFIEQGLTEESFLVDVARDGEAALERAARTAYDLVILDLMLPGIDGFAVCRAIRSGGADTPILVLSSRGSVQDRVKGLELGADDYLTKPFAFAELFARVRSITRREPAARPTTLNVADLELDPATHEVRRGEVMIELSPTEYALLEYFMRHPGQVLSRTQILEHVWDFAYDGTSNVVDVYVRYLREKIDRPFAIESLRTVRGAGYVLRPTNAATTSNPAAAPAVHART